MFPLIIVFIKRLPDAYLLSGAESGPYTPKCHHGVCVCAHVKETDVNAGSVMPYFMVCWALKI